jgi:hypothetical protein
MGEVVEKNIFEDDKLIELIKSNFNEDDNKLFELSFKLYTSTKANSDEFVISLDDIYKWVGFSRKDNAKILLKKHFKEDTDYKILLRKLAEQTNSSDTLPKRGGINKEKILLSIDTFKMFCLLAATQQSKSIYKYYIKMEKIIFKYIEEKYKEQTNINQNNKQLLEIKDKQLEENNQLLEIKDKQLEENNQLLEIKDKQLEDYNKELEFIKNNFNPNVNLKYEEIEKNEHVYVFTTDIPHVYKVGETKNDVKYRKSNLQTGNVKNIEVKKDYITSNKKILEDIAHYILDYYRSKSDREHFRCNLSYIENILEISCILIHTLKSTYENITKKELIDMIIEKLNNYLNDDNLNEISIDNHIELPTINQIVLPTNNQIVLTVKKNLKDILSEYFVITKNSKDKIKCSEFVILYNKYSVKEFPAYKIHKDMGLNGFEIYRSNGIKYYTGIKEKNNEE